MGGIQNLIICVKMAWSEHLAGSDCGDEYSLNTLQKSAICLYFLPETSVKTQATELSGKNSVILFEITRIESVNPRIAALFYASVMKVLKVRPVIRRKK